MRISAIAAAVAAALSTTAYAADPAEAVATVASSLHDEGALEQVIVTGTRRTERTVLESLLSPVSKAFHEAARER